ncbi:MAG: hypothetical protein HC822_24870 [Oscillochloris sp.]|nr:hypothetical protein [Oscillochloris sp.]
MTLILAALIGMLASIPLSTLAIQHSFQLSPGDSLTIDCPTALRGRVRGGSATLTCAPERTTATPTSIPPTATSAPPTATSIPPTATPVAGATPIAGEECPAWVHERYVAVGPDGNNYPTWHPPVDETYGCYFDHEHGSDPQEYVGFAEAGMPLFGYTATQHGMDEPHNGFKVFVANNDLNGRAWMILLHQGTGSPRRALAQFHTLDWHISDRSGRTLADLHLMADFGYASPNCRPDEAIPGSAAGRPFSRHDPARRSIPTLDCAAETPYETWTAAIDIGGYFQATPAFDIDNATTIINRANLEDLRFMCEIRSPEQDCRSADTQWTGNKRGVIRPGQFVNNTSGSPWVFTDVFGNPVDPNSGEHMHGVIRQYISTSGWDTRQCCGNEVVFRIQTYSNGLYIANPTEEAGSTEFGVGRHHWPN